MNMLEDVVYFTVYRKQCLHVLHTEGRKHRVIAHGVNHANSNNAVANAQSVTKGLFTRYDCDYDCDLYIYRN